MSLTVRERRNFRRSSVSGEGWLAARRSHVSGAFFDEFINWSDCYLSGLILTVFEEPFSPGKS